MNHSDAFIHGLGAFLVGHIFYAIAFRSVSSERRLHWQLAHLIPFGIWCGVVLVYLHQFGNTGPFFIPLCGYTILLMVVCWNSSLAALDRIAHAELPMHLAFWQKYAPVIGAVLFTSSDMMIAFDKFLPAFYSSSTTRMIYMILYYVGQWAIAYSTIERKGSAKRAAL
jgi:uncharacterized membrane protein YhhN